MATDAAATTGTGADGGTASSGPGLPARQLSRALALDVGLPVVAYYALHTLGVSNLAALLAATGVAGARTVWSAVRQRSLNPFAGLMLVVFGVGVLLSLVSGDARFLLLKDSMTTGMVGLAFLVTTVRGRPLTFTVTQALLPARRAALVEAYRTDPRVRRGHRTSSVIWGAGLLVEAVVRVPLVYLLPVPVMVGVSNAMMLTAFIVLMVGNIWYIRWVRARSEAAPKTGSPVHPSCRSASS